jgi:hypothetical protein
MLGPEIFCVTLLAHQLLALDFNDIIEKNLVQKITIKGIIEK